MINSVKFEYNKFKLFKLFEISFKSLFNKSIKSSVCFTNASILSGDETILDDKFFIFSLIFFTKFKFIFNLLSNSFEFKFKVYITCSFESI